MEPNCRERYYRLNHSIRTLRSEISMAGFDQLGRAALADGAMSRKSKELICLGIAISARSEDCIMYHVHDAICAGATREEILETIEVAILMGGGPAVVYGTKALHALEQFQAARVRSPTCSRLEESYEQSSKDDETEVVT